MQVGGRRVREKRKGWLWRATKELFGPEHPQLVTFGSVVAFGASELVPQDSRLPNWLFSWGLQPTLFWAAVVLAFYGVVIGFFLNARSRDSVEDLSQSLEAADQQLAAQRAVSQSVIEHLLVALATEAGVYNTTCRATIYAHNGQHFVRLARISDNPELRKPGRTIYPDSQGAISHAWQHLVYEKMDFPSSRSAWEKYLVTKLGFHASLAKALSMQSRSLMAVRVPSQTTPRAIVVVESLERDGFDKGLHKKFETIGAWSTLSAVISTSNDSIPDIMDAKAKGF